MAVTKEELIAFENDIAECFNRGEIRAPVHLSGGNEEQLIDIFKQIKPEDYVCGAWRMHFHCLLKGVPPDKLKADILAGKSIALCYPEYRIISSGIAGGILPIATGIAWSLKHQKRPERVWVFIGDMTAHMGIFEECQEYACGSGLCITYIIEDNDLSVCTNTFRAWNPNYDSSLVRVKTYRYSLNKPHVGTGKWVTF